MQPSVRFATQSGTAGSAEPAIAVCASVNGHAQAVIVAPQTPRKIPVKPS